MTLIIVEGPDRSGKSTLCKRLVDENQRETWHLHNGPPPSWVGNARDHLLHRYLRQAYVAGALHDEGVDVVLDRAHLSEYVLGYEYRGLTNGDGLIRFEEDLLKGCPHTVLVTLTPNAADLVERDDGESTWSHEDPIEARKQAGRELRLFLLEHEQSRLEKCVFHGSHVRLLVDHVFRKVQQVRGV